MAVTETMVRMGELAVSSAAGDVLVSLGLGSCIGLALVDRKMGIAGLAHVVLPDSAGQDDAGPGKFADRAVTVHLKDHDAANDKALLGEGTLNWDEVFSICEGSGKTEWYIVEQESYAFPPLECVRRCRENLRKMGR